MSSATTVLQYGSADGFQYFSVNDLAGTFTLNRLNLVDNTRVQLSGNPLRFDGTAPIIVYNSPGSDPLISNSIEFATTTTYQANATGNLLTLSGTLSGAGGLTVTGAVSSNGGGRLMLSNSGPNTYAGGTTITGGSRLDVSRDNQLGSGGVTLNGGTLNFVNAPTSARNFTLVGPAAGNILANGGTNTTISGLVTGSGGLTVRGLYTLANAANDYTGETVVRTNTLRITSGTALGSTAGGTVISGEGGGTGTLEVSGSITVAEPLRLEPGNGSARLASTGGANTWSGPVTLRGGASVEVAAGSVLTISGPVTDGAAPGGLSVGGFGGPGTLKLTNANTYTGQTTVFSGTLLASNTSGSATGPADVGISANGTLGGILGGTGTIAGRVIAYATNATATINPGDSTLGANQRGNLTLNGGLILSSGSQGDTYRWDLGALSTANPGIDHDRLTVGGTLTLGGASRLTLDFGALGADSPDSANAFWQSPHNWTVLDFTGTGPQSDNFGAITSPTYGPDRRPYGPRTHRHLSGGSRSDPRALATPARESGRR